MVITAPGERGRENEMENETCPDMLEAVLSTDGSVPPLVIVSEQKLLSSQLKRGVQWLLHIPNTQSVSFLCIMYFPTTRVRGYCHHYTSSYMAERIRAFVFLCSDLQPKGRGSVTSSSFPRLSVES